MFLRLESLEHDNYFIHLDWHLISDYAPLTVNIAIFEEFVQSKKYTLVKKQQKRRQIHH